MFNVQCALYRVGGDLFFLSRTLPTHCSGSIIMGLSVSTTDDHVALTTDNGKLLLVDLIEAAAAAAEARGSSSNGTSADAEAATATGMSVSSSNSEEQVGDRGGAVHLSMA